MDKRNVMNVFLRTWLLALVLSATTTPALEAQETPSTQSLSLAALAGAAGASQETVPILGTEVAFENRDAFGRGHVFDAAVGTTYGRIGYMVLTPIGALRLSGMAAPLPAEYEVITAGVKEELPIEAPTYSASLQYLIGAAKLQVGAVSSVTWQAWESNDSDVVAPADRVSLSQELRADYWLRRSSWTSNVLAPDAGWRLGGGYNAVFRPGFESWGRKDSLVGHDGGPQQGVNLEVQGTLPLGNQSPWAALGLSGHWTRSFSAYERDLPRFGQPLAQGGLGVSGYAPDSLPSSRGSVVTASVASALGERVLMSLRFDWFHDHSDGEEELRGVGFGLGVKSTELSMLDLSLGFAVDPAERTEVPLAGSLMWKKEMEL
jgi:hypothetical protein